MSDLVVVGFDDPHGADRVLTDLNRLQKEYLVDLEDAVVATRDPDGKLRLKQSIDLVGTGAATGGLWGAMWGSLVGLLFLNPLIGMAAGAALGAGAGALLKIGVLTGTGTRETLAPHADFCLDSIAALEALLPRSVAFL